MKDTETDCLQSYFSTFRNKIVGIDAYVSTPYGKKPLIYTDWTASGRLYMPIERKLSDEFGPLLANTHTETSFTGQIMTNAYHRAQRKIKEHLLVGDDFVIFQAGYGMTGAVNKLQRILGWKVHEKYRKAVRNSIDKIPVVFVSRLEHHSNHISWLETIADVVLIPNGENGLPDLDAYEALLKKYEGRPVYLSVTGCSNVTGITPDLKNLFLLTRRYDGKIFIDHACSGPYVDMNPFRENPLLIPDAFMFSPHKFLGGPGTGGILVLRKNLYHNRIPDEPGGGTVVWTDPWHGAEYSDDIETRETGGTPGFLLLIKTALAIELKEKMGIDNIRRREEEILEKLLPAMENIPGISILEGRHKNRLGVISFVSGEIPHTLITRLLNDLFGIQARGGCSCAGTYGHDLFRIDKQHSAYLKKRILNGHPEDKPGWTRISIHPTTSDKEIDTVLEALEYIRKHGKDIARKDYYRKNGDYFHRNFDYRKQTEEMLQKLFRL